MAMFVGLFHSSWYFKSCLASSAPMLHLQTLKQMEKLKVLLPELAMVVLNSIQLHLWYLTPQGIPLSLVDESLSDDARSWIAVGIFSTPRPTVHLLGKPSFPDLSSWPTAKWLSDQVPELSSLHGPDSWLLFNKLV